MSKAFTKEDHAPTERSTRMRPASGLPPGAVNYMTAEGARRLRGVLAGLADAGSERVGEIARILAAATIVGPPAEIPPGAVFGATVEVRDAGGESRSFRVVGVDEVNIEPHWVSWPSPTGRSLIGAEPGQRVTIEVDGESRKFTVVRIEY